MRREQLATFKGADMTAQIPERASASLVDGSIVAIAGNTMPPRDPNKDDDGEGDEDEDEEENGDADDEPAVIREPDE
jgi:hypothetical protein